MVFERLEKLEKIRTKLELEQIRSNSEFEKKKGSGGSGSRADTFGACRSRCSRHRGRRRASRSPRAAGRWRWLGS